MSTEPCPSGCPLHPCPECCPQSTCAAGRVVADTERNPENPAMRFCATHHCALPDGEWTCDPDQDDCEPVDSLTAWVDPEMRRWRVWMTVAVACFAGLATVIVIGAVS